MSRTEMSWNPPAGAARWGLLAILAVTLATFFLFLETWPRTYPLRLSAGDALGRRHAIAKLLA